MAGLYGLDECAPKSVLRHQPSGNTAGFQMRKRSSYTRICTGAVTA